MYTHTREVFVSSEFVQPTPTLVWMEAKWKEDAVEEDEARRKRSIAWTRTASGSARQPGVFKLGLSVEEQNKRREQRDEAFFERTGLTVANARNLNAMDLDGPPATRKQPSSHSYSLTHPVKLTHEQKESIKQKILAPVVRIHSDEPSRPARAAR